MILWLVLGGSVLAAAAIVRAYWLAVHRYRRMTAPSHDDPGICFYLHDETVVNLQGEYKALQQEVEERWRSSTEGRVSAEVHGVGAHGAREAEKEKTIRYIADEGPVTVIRRIIAELERANKIVHVDLFTESFEPTNGLDHAFRPVPGKNPAWRRSARLRDLKPLIFVSVMGRFRVTDKTDKTTTFSAPYGDPADPTSEPRQVSVTCVTAQLRREDVPTGPFPARCLGRIQKWDPDTKRLVIDPVLAIFQ
ncbi:hypothetical protein KIPE111705_18275 [Kibdelosporangium persicum]|uniref:Uncharacterized protein n=1 Tax=Kibdelosporangium persicum TaxID=2698649 RepID=A0ABX2FB40_9PSEU|nr:hypothetical protein [Kibdelosporangium persicum]NRN68588.1 hypothetical protein [Kibdelosporangium persicum]